MAPKTKNEEQRAAADVTATAGLAADGGRRGAARKYIDEPYTNELHGRLFGHA